MTRETLCATAARRRGDPLIGTAAPARRWLLVEYPAGWAPQAMTSGRLADGIGARLGAAAVAAGGRALLVRRPGRRLAADPGTARRWAVVDADGGRQWGEWRTTADLDEAVAAVADGPTATVGASGDTDPLLLVCTHGRHDTCCAVRGRPVAAALARRWPDGTWECSHVGGDRFAPTLLLLPDGVCYGQVDADDAVGLVERHLAGQVDVDRLRGFSGRPPVVQAALAAALRAGRLDARSALTVAAQVADDAPTPAGDPAWLVTLTPDSGTVPVRVVRTTAAPARLTCSATAEGRAHRWSAEVLAPPPG